jgi:hypothetical protein
MVSKKQFTLLCFLLAFVGCKKNDPNKSSSTTACQTGINPHKCDTTIPDSFLLASKSTEKTDDKISFQTQTLFIANAKQDDSKSKRAEISYWVSENETQIGKLVQRIKANVQFAFEDSPGTEYEKFAKKYLKPSGTLLFSEINSECPNTASFAERIKFLRLGSLFEFYSGEDIEVREDTKSRILASVNRSAQNSEALGKNIPLQGYFSSLAPKPEQSAIREVEAAKLNTPTCGKQL